MFTDKKQTAFVLDTNAFYDLGKMFPAAYAVGSIFIFGQQLCTLPHLILFSVLKFDNGSAAYYAVGSAAAGETVIEFKIM